MHGNIVPLLVFLGLGVCVSMAVNRFAGNRWPLIVLSAAVTIVLWNAGVFILLLLTAPNELKGGIVLRPAVVAFLLAMMPALLVFVAYRAANARPKAEG